MLNAKLLARLDARMEEWVAAGRYGGLEWLIGDAAGGVLHRGRAGAKGIGGPEMPARPIHRIYSMTKPIVSLAAMQMVEEGRLRLQAPVADHLPEYAEMEVLQPGGGRRKAERRMTVHHLLTHMAGLFYGFPGEPLEKEIGETGLLRGAAPLRDEVRRLAELPLDFEPGTGWRYSFATDVLGAVLEEIEGRPLGAILRDRVTGPLGMAETVFLVPEGERDRIMTMHLGRDAARPLDDAKLYPPDDPDYARGGHGMFSTIDDYARLSAALLRLATEGGPVEGLVGRRTLEAMTANHVPEALLPLHIELIDRDRLPGLDGYGFGLGFYRALGHGGRLALATPGAFGWSGAAETWFTVDPASGLHGVFMAQNLDWPGASVDFQNMLTAAIA